MWNISYLSLQFFIKFCYRKLWQLGFFSWFFYELWVRVSNIWNQNVLELLLLFGGSKLICHICKGIFGTLIQLGSHDKWKNNARIWTSLHGKLTGGWQNLSVITRRVRGVVIILGAYKKLIKANKIKLFRVRS